MKAFFFFLCLLSVFASGPNVRSIRERGTLRCGVAFPDSPFRRTNGTGFEVAFCEAVAYAILGNWNSVELVSTDSANRFTMLGDGSVDLLVRSTTNTIGRQTGNTIPVKAGVRFSSTYLYASQFVLASSSASSDPSKFVGTMCVPPATTLEDNIRAYFAGNSQVTVMTLSADEIVQGLNDGTCDGTVDDEFSLSFILEGMGSSSSNWKILSSVSLSRDPLAVATLRNQPLSALVEAVVTGLILADQYGITSSNVDSWTAVFPEEERLLTQFPAGKSSVIMKDIIRELGNYGELYDMYLEQYVARSGSRQAQWKDGGLLYAVPWL